MIAKVGVVGAGEMGTDIVQACALAGFDVVFIDRHTERLQQAQAAIDSSLVRKLERGRIAIAEKEAARARIATGMDLAGLADCDLVLEAVTEDEGVKRELYKSLAGILKPEAIIATNTSSISVTRLAVASDRPGRFMGIHFMKPAPVMQLVELIRGIATTDETFNSVQEFVTRLGKTAAVAEDFPAFIVNRILLPMINEAVYALYEGVGTVEAIDVAMRLGANHPMGPLELADFIGLDNCQKALQTLYESLADSKYRPCPLLVKYVEAGWLGRKTGKGFYDYSGAKPVPTR